MPRLGIRECFIPRDGYVFAFADYDGLELRTVAQVCLSLLGQSKLAEDLNSGNDPHCRVAGKILKIPYEDAVAWYADSDRKDWQTIYEARQTGKAANFGFPGGCGIARLCDEARVKYGVTLTETESRELKEIWLDMCPEFRPYFSMVDDMTRASQPFEQLFSGRIRAGCNFTDGANTLFQGLGADATKAAGFALTKECRIGKGPLRGGHPVVYVHDEFWAEVREEAAHEAALDLARIMCEASAPYLPQVPPKTKPGLARRMSKKAKAIKDANGRLIPWDG